jgi:FMN phosphatase YigB (HAD superfamily)
MDKVILVGLDVLVQYPSSWKRKKIKEDYTSKLLQGFVYTKQFGVLYDNFISQINAFVSNSILDKSLIDISEYKLFSDAVPSLENLKKLGYSIVVTSDSSHPVKCSHIIESLGISSFIDRIITYKELGVKKSHEDYISKIISLYGLTEELYLVASRLDKEFISANKHKIKHVWVNSTLEHIVNAI